MTNEKYKIQETHFNKFRVVRDGKFDKKNESKNVGRFAFNIDTPISVDFETKEDAQYHLDRIDNGDIREEDSIRDMEEQREKDEKNRKNKEYNRWAEQLKLYRTCLNKIEKH